MCIRDRASILPEQGEQVSGVLWSITEKCEKSLDYYEGYPYLYGKQDILVQCEDGQELYAAVYIMNEPYQSQPSLPGKLYPVSYTHLDVYKRQG